MRPNPKQKSVGMFLFKKSPSLDFNCLDYPMASVKIIKICLCHQTHRKGLCRKESASRGKDGITAKLYEASGRARLWDLPMLKWRRMQMPPERPELELKGMRYPYCQGMARNVTPQTHLQRWRWPVADEHVTH